MLPDFVILGAQKAGTVFLHRGLAAHPAVFMPPGETRVFEDPEWASFRRETFEASFAAAGPEQTVGMVRPDTLARPECPQRVHRILPEARLIAVLRDPMERAISAYFHLMKYGFLPALPVEEGLTRLLDGRSEGHPKAHEVLDYGFYHEHLERYLALYARERLLVLRFEELVERPAESLGEAFRFLDVDPAPAAAIAATARRENPGNYSLARQRLAQLRSRLLYRTVAGGTKIDFDWDPGPARALAGKALSALDRALAPLLGTRRPRLSPALAGRLRAFYAEDVAATESLLGWDLSTWRTAAGGRTAAHAAAHPSPSPDAGRPAPRAA